MLKAWKQKEAVIDEGGSPGTPDFSQKRTLVDFLAAADEMDPDLWEATWDRSLYQLQSFLGNGDIDADAERGMAEEPSVSEMQSREALLASVVVGCAIDRGWSKSACSIWRVVLPLLAHIWGSLSEDICLQRIGRAVRLFSQSGICRIFLERQDDQEQGVLELHTRGIALIEYGSECFLPWFRDYLTARAIPHIFRFSERCLQRPADQTLSQEAVFLLEAGISVSFSSDS